MKLQDISTAPRQPESPQDVHVIYEDGGQTQPEHVVLASCWCEPEPIGNARAGHAEVWVHRMVH